MLHPPDLQTLRDQIQSCAKSRQWLTHTFRLRQAGGQVIYISESRRALRDGGAKLCGYEGFWIDITRQTFAEARLLQSVWKETLGDLTPGLAHDFNNVLTGILTLSEAFLAQIDSKHTFHEGLSLIKQKALEASRLTHRIARLHQEKTGRRSYQDVNSTVTEVLELLGKVITKRYELRTTLAGESLPGFVDRREFHRILLSLALAAINNKSNSGGLHFHTSRHDTPPLPVPGKGKLARRPVIGVRLIASSSIISPEQLEMLLDPRAAAIEEIAGMALSLRHASLFLE